MDKDADMTWICARREISPTQFVVDVPYPEQVTDITFFLLPHSPVPLGYAGTRPRIDHSQLTSE